MITIFIRHTPPSLFAITCHSTTASPWTTEWWLELDRISVVSDPNQFVCFQVNLFLISDHRKPRKQDAVMVLLRTANAIFWWKLEYIWGEYILVFIQGAFKNGALNPSGFEKYVFKKRSVLKMSMSSWSPSSWARHGDGGLI